jgi:hypothetical protein
MAYHFPDSIIVDLSPGDANGNLKPLHQPPDFSKDLQEAGYSFNTNYHAANARVHALNREEYRSLPNVEFAGHGDTIYSAHGRLNHHFERANNEEHTVIAHNAHTSGIFDSDEHAAGGTSHPREIPNAKSSEHVVQRHTDLDMYAYGLSAIKNGIKSAVDLSFMDLSGARTDGRRAVNDLKNAGTAWKEDMEMVGNLALDVTVRNPAHAALDILRTDYTEAKHILRLYGGAASIVENSLKAGLSGAFLDGDGVVEASQRVVASAGKMADETKQMFVDAWHGATKVVGDLFGQY